ncbi:DinB family protein [Paenactinomyces guangxiensis]|uniref:DinB family protein n=1 Tax=Paenactinomyces guangxiensis TaxID=1490290 RepID=A0A7W1WQ96_9BACL|nr:DinB family protein [Paenactinomyces guangxiensis]MBA4493918.1 DinB family protein [Paenactinomyces guangxiensis]MBH8591384.1 DinB family protein [Paenactinomyces guangxiensis]
MSRKEMILDCINQAFNEEAWYPPLEQALKGVTSTQACWRPEGKAANTIWENVNHLLIYKERLLARLSGKAESFSMLSDNDDTFFQSSPDDEAAWQAVVSRTIEVHQALKQKLLSLQESELDTPSPVLPVWQQVTNIVLHDAYHTGQIVQIRKLQGSWPEQRSFS